MFLTCEGEWVSLPTNYCYQEVHWNNASILIRFIDGKLSPGNQVCSFILSNQDIVVYITGDHIGTAASRKLVGYIISEKWEQPYIDITDMLNYTYRVLLTTDYKGFSVPLSHVNDAKLISKYIYTLVENGEFNAAGFKQENVDDMIKTFMEVCNK